MGSLVGLGRPGDEATTWVAGAVTTHSPLLGPTAGHPGLPDVLLALLQSPLATKLDWVTVCLTLGGGAGRTVDGGGGEGQGRGEGIVGGGAGTADGGMVGGGDGGRRGRDGGRWGGDGTHVRKRCDGQHH